MTNKIEKVEKQNEFHFLWLADIQHGKAQLNRLLCSQMNGATPLPNHVPQ